MAFRSIGYRLSAYVLLIAFVVGLLGASGVLCLTYFREHDRIEQTAAQIEEVHLPGLIATIWNLDEERYAVELKALHALRHVAFVELTVDGKTITEGKRLTDNGGCIERRFPLVHSSGDQLGTLLVQFSRQSVWADIWHEARTIVSYLLLPFVAMAVAILVVFRRLVSRPINRLAQHARTLTMENLSAEVPSPHLSAGRDELSNLLQSFDTMRSNLAVQVRQREEAEQKYRSVFDGTLEALFIHDGDTGRILDVNRRMLELYRCTREQALSATVGDICADPPEKTNAEAMRRIQRALAGESLLFEVRARDFTGRIFWVEVGLTKTMIGAKTCVVASVRDISARKEMEEQLHQAQKMESLGRLAGGVAHDFNNMLGGIMGAAELLRIGSDGRNPEQERYLDLIMSASGRTSDLIKRLLAFSRKRPAETGPVDVHELLLDTSILLERSMDKRIALHLDFGASRPIVIGDSAQIQSAVLNLGLNARDAMPSGGQMRIETKTLNLEKDSEFCRLNKLEPGAYVQISVADSGTGIKPEHLERIFEPFFTTKEAGRGTGLGLAAVYGTMLSHGGCVTVESEVGKGSVFRLFLKAATEGALARPQKVPEAPKEMGRVLLIDDEEIIRETAKALLEDMGYEVTAAEDGPSGLAAFKDRKGRIDVVMLDMIMPRMGGREVIDALRRIDPSVRVLVCSGYAPDDEMLDLCKQKSIGFVHKPYLARELSEAIQRLLQRA